MRQRMRAQLPVRTGYGFAAFATTRVQREPDTPVSRLRIKYLKLISSYLRHVAN
jgi:hypothetical protein